MPSHQEMVAVVDAYIAAFAAGSPDEILELYETDAVVEDPLGSTPSIGHAAILAFYTQTMSTGAKLTLEGPIRTAANVAAFAFTAHFTLENIDYTVSVIDIFQFSGNGRISKMHAVFSPEHVSTRPAVQ